MKRLLNPDIQCTDPDQLQFCLKISDTVFWYCEPNTSHRDLLPCAETESNRIYQRYLGHPTEFLHDAHNVPEVRKFATDNMLWREGETDGTDFSWSEQEELLKDYGYKWDDFSADIDRNQIICENHFEQYLLDYRNDI